MDRLFHMGVAVFKCVTFALLSIMVAIAISYFMQLFYMVKHG